MPVVYELMRAHLTIRVALGIGAVSLTALSSCGGSSSACGVPVRDELDPGSFVHVLNPDDATFRTNPPSSGPHLSTPAPTGIVDTPLQGVVQVSILERGDVLVQYRDDADRAAAVALAAEGIVVAPQPDLPKPVVVTAWTYRLSCSAVDADAIRTFADTHLGKAQEH